MHPFYQWHEIISFVVEQSRRCLILPIIAATGWHDSWNVYTRSDKNQFEVILRDWRVRVHASNHKMGKYVYTVMKWWRHHQQANNALGAPAATGDTQISKHVIHERVNNINKHNLTHAVDGRRLLLCLSQTRKSFCIYIGNGERYDRQCSGHAPNISAYLIFKYGWLIDGSTASALYLPLKWYYWWWKMSVC